MDIKVSPANKIQVFLDGDEGLPIDVCAKVSRCLEAKLDRDEEDFELTVSSSGADAPLVLPRQYTKHVGRTLDVYDADGNSFQGELSSLNENAFIISFSKKQKDPDTGKKKKVEIQKEFAFDQVKKVRVKVLI